MLGGGAFVANLVLWRESGYFDEEAVRKPLLHLWSLGVEEQFYIAFPLLFGVLWRLTRRVRLAGWLTFLVALAMGVSTASADETARFYSPLSRAWELGAGVALAMLDLNRSRRTLTEAARRVWLLAWCMGCLLLLASLVWRATGGFLHQHPAVLSVLGTCLMVASGGRLPSVPLSAVPFVSLGRISYPVYLWHWPLFAFTHITIGEALSTPGKLALLVAALLLGWATTRWVEAPLRFGRQRWVVPALLAAMLTLMGAGAWLMGAPSAMSRPVDSGQARQFDYGMHWSGWRDCDAIQASPQLGGCKRMDAVSSVLFGQVVVLGDSHAGHLASGLKEGLQGKGLGVDILLHAGCLPILPREASHGRDFECPDQAIEQGLQHILHTEAVRVVVLAGYHVAYVSGHRLHQRDVLPEREQRRRMQAWQDGMAEMLHRLQDGGKQVLVLKDTPEILGDPRSCVRRGWPFGAACRIDMPLDEVLTRARTVDAAMAALEERFPRVVFFDLRSGLCDAQACHASGRGELWYASRDHLTPAGSRQAVQPLVSALLKIAQPAR